MSRHPLMRLALQALVLAGLGLAGASSAEVHGKVDPYIEVQQVLTADLNGAGDDVLTYTSVAAGIDASIDSNRVKGQVSYRYERHISWNDDDIDESVHSGVAQARVEVVPKTLAIDAGAFAARARADSGGPVYGITSVQDPNAAQVYSLYAGPSLTTHVGAVDVAASYRIGYVHVSDDSDVVAPVSPGTARYDRYDHGVTQDAALSLGMKPGELPFGWTVGAGYVREDADPLNQKYEGEYVRGDIVVPISGSFALTGGVGYEKIKSSQSNILRDSGGVPILAPTGDAIPDTAHPRLLTYDDDGLIWDAGVIYRPGRRTELQARVGHRYGSMSYTGSFHHEFDRSFGVTAEVYDSVDSFGRLVVADLKDMPTSFNANRNLLNGGFAGAGGCVFGSQPGQGVCFDDALQSITSGNFRNRGVNIVFSGTRGPWSFDFGGGYSNRKYYQASFAGGLPTVDWVRDESWTVNADIGRKLSRTSSLSFDAYAAWYDSHLTGEDKAFGAGATLSFTHSLLFDRLQFEAAAGLYHTDSATDEADFASGLVGLRYTF